MSGSTTEAMAMFHQELAMVHKAMVLARMTISVWFLLVCTSDVTVLVQSVMTCIRLCGFTNKSSVFYVWCGGVQSFVSGLARLPFGRRPVFYVWIHDEAMATVHRQLAMVHKAMALVRISIQSNLPHIL